MRSIGPEVEADLVSDQSQSFMSNMKNKEVKFAFVQCSVQSLDNCPYTSNLVIKLLGTSSIPTHMPKIKVCTRRTHMNLLCKSTKPLCQLKMNIRRLKMNKFCLQNVIKYPHAKFQLHPTVRSMYSKRPFFHKAQYMLLRGLSTSA